MIQGRWIENYQYVHWLKLPQLCPSGAMVNPVPVGYHSVFGWLAMVYIITVVIFGLQN